MQLCTKRGIDLARYLRCEDKTAGETSIDSESWRVKQPVKDSSFLRQMSEKSKLFVPGGVKECGTNRTS